VSPRVITRLAEYRSACDQLRAQGGLALVPTMGALHAGHAALIAHAARVAARVAVTIFVNPTQFGPNEDFDRYPRDLERDVATCGQAGAHLVFAPERAEMYPAGEATRVSVARLTETLCGPWRPGHFEGVATIVTKLLSATGPCRAVFGRKDYQQLQVIRRLSTDLLLPVEVIDHATVRDGDGLAMSSRNRYLSPAQRTRALAIPRALSRVGARFSAGEHAAQSLVSELQSALAEGDLEVEYASLAHSADLHLIAEGDVAPGEAGVFVAARVGATRLIDNLILGVDPLPMAAGP
jgi:pantoate--beta-alanine ligase